MNNELATIEIQERSLDLEIKKFEMEQRRSMALSKSAFFPKDLQGDVASAVIIYDLAKRMNISVMEVSQSIYIIYNRPSFSTTFLVARLNQSGLIDGALRVMVSKDKQEAFCLAVDKASGKELRGMTVTMKMARDEGWIDKRGSKWKTMPELMLRKRCQSFFIKEYYPQVMFGLQSTEEAQDITDSRPRYHAAVKEPLITKVEKPQKKQEQIEEFKMTMPEMAKPKEIGAPKKVEKEIVIPKPEHWNLKKEFGEWCDMDYKTEFLEKKIKDLGFEDGPSLIKNQTLESQKSFYMEVVNEFPLYLKKVKREAKKAKKDKELLAKMQPQEPMKFKAEVIAFIREDARNSSIFLQKAFVAGFKDDDEDIDKIIKSMEMNLDDDKLNSFINGLRKD